MGSGAETVRVWLGWGAVRLGWHLRSRKEHIPQRGSRSRELTSTEPSEASVPPRRFPQAGAGGRAGQEIFSHPAPTPCPRRPFLLWARVGGHGSLGMEEGVSLRLRGWVLGIPRANAVGCFEVAQKAGPIQSMGHTPPPYLPGERREGSQNGGAQPEKKAGLRGLVILPWLWVEPVWYKGGSEGRFGICKPEEPSPIECRQAVGSWKPEATRTHPGSQRMRAGVCPNPSREKMGVG